MFSYTGNQEVAVRASVCCACVTLWVACGPVSQIATGMDDTPDDTPDGAAPAGMDLGSRSGVQVGMEARVTAGGLNLRSGPGTSNAILDVMHCGDRVQVVGGPSAGWWNVTWQTTTGWASGNYLVGDAQFDPSVCGGSDGGTVDAPPGEPSGIDPADIFARAKLGVGYSYYWGHGSWRSDGASVGSCTGSCPSCTHTGQYGADCSGFVGKCWQAPVTTPLEEDLHPYSTYDFYNATTHWSQVPRSQIAPADAMVYNANGHGHIVLFESGSDPWGNVWVYEARGCSYGVQHNLRTIDTSYIAIRRDGL
jgi:hypothetical protein